MNIDKLTQFEKDDLLRLALYFMPMDKQPARNGFNRQALMRDRPTAYNKLCQTDIVRVVKVDTGEDIATD